MLCRRLTVNFVLLLSYAVESGLCRASPSVSYNVVPLPGTYTGAAGQAYDCLLIIRLSIDSVPCVAHSRITCKYAVMPLIVLISLEGLPGLETYMDLLAGKSIVVCL